MSITICIDVILFIVFLLSSDKPSMQFVPITINNKYALIPLTKGKWAIVDIEDWNLLAYKRWFASERGKHLKTWYAARSEGGRKNKHIVYMHRLILPDCNEVDHLDHNGLNNVKDNLIAVNRSQQMQNTRKRLDCYSECVGVNFHKRKRNKKWTAQVEVDGAVHHLGYFETEDEAISARLDGVNRYSTHPLAV